MITYADLLSLINSPAGKHLLGVNDAEKVIAVTKNSIQILKDKIGGKWVIRSYFWMNDHVVDTLFPILSQLSIVSDYQKITNPYEAFLHYAGFIYKPNKYPGILLDTYQQNPLGGGGRAWRASQTDWTTARDSASSTNTDTAAVAASSKNGTNDYANFRTFCPFDTSSITANGTITAGVLDFHRNDSFQTFLNVNSTTLEIVVTQQASVSSLATSDYSLFTNTSKGSLAFSATSTGGYNSITISDLTIISKTSNTKLGVVTGRDLVNSEPTGANAVGSGTLPRLTITYTTPPITLSQNSLATGFLEF